ncbi:hypothetical protein [Trichormus variabilis]|uniref:Uncharacterized protein n=1 Tax=Trichormus variabilis SAG 1403-4b TaxID=447716 RepID=A0A3S1C058_ANAVA|nr:hypothetical protein [Trichormus variabilis]MBD2629157.1 hypothetical protein [Trichormus variabilis FACHB-164]RUS94236.1 hypothetical protein DSM107003_37670 [Trichormus variabilis SAG 1403-4b]
MSIQRSQIETALSSKLPKDILIELLNEYQNIKQNLLLRKFRPTELNAARFSECILRLIEFLDIGNSTPFGKQLDTQKIINRVTNNTTLPESIRFFIPQLTKVLLDIRNKRNVAHVGGEVDPNYSDSLFVAHSVDWILIELIRNYHTNSIDEARKIVTSINETKIPLITEVDGFIRVQNTKLNSEEKTLIILYYKQPDKISDSDLAKWIKYTNQSRYRTQILKALDNEALIHYENNWCVILPKGIAHIEKNINLELIV